MSCKDNASKPRGVVKLEPAEVQMEDKQQIKPAEEVREDASQAVTTLSGKCLDLLGLFSDSVLISKRKLSDCIQELYYTVH